MKTEKEYLSAAYELLVGTNPEANNAEELIATMRIATVALQLQAADLQQDNWQPIDTLDLRYPADLLVACVQRGWVTRAFVHYPQGELILVGSQFAPTHWQPLPAAPTK